MLGKNDKHIPQMVVSLMVMNPMVQFVKKSTQQPNTSKIRFVSTNGKAFRVNSQVGGAFFLLKTNFTKEIDWNPLLMASQPTPPLTYPPQK